MRHVVVGSANPVKIAAVQAVVSRIWPVARCTGLAVASGVAAQPWGDEETQRGATHRARAALLESQADLAIGLEGGVVSTDGGARTCAWAAAVDSHGTIGVGGSMSLPLPPGVVTLLGQGMELSDAIDAVAGTVGSGVGIGAVGVLTGGLVDRQGAYEALVAYALAPWLAPTFFAVEDQEIH